MYPNNNNCNELIRAYTLGPSANYMRIHDQNTICPSMIINNECAKFYNNDFQTKGGWGHHGIW